MSEDLLAAVERSIGCDFFTTENLHTTPNTKLFLCKSSDGESYFVVKSNTRLVSFPEGDLILKVDECLHNEQENEYYYYSKLKNSFKTYVNFIEQIQGESFSSTEWKFAKLLNEKDVMTLCWQLIYLFSKNSGLVGRETMIIERMDDGVVNLRVFPVSIGNDSKVAERLIMLLLELVAIYLDLPNIPQHFDEVRQVMDTIENLPLGSNELLIHSIVPTLKSLINVEKPDLYEILTLFLFQMVNLDSHQYWSLLSSLSSNIHNRTVVDIWIESQKLFEQKQYEKALAAILDIKKEYSDSHPIVSFLTGEIYYELYRQSFYKLHYPGEATLLACALHYFTQAANISRNNIHYLERKLECHFRKWILDNELNLDKSNKEMNELIAEIDHLIENNPKSSSLYSMKSSLFFVHAIRFGALAEDSHMTTSLTLAEVAMNNSPSTPRYQLLFEWISFFFSKEGKTKTFSLETDDAKFILFQTIITCFREQDSDELVSKLLTHTDYRQTVIDTLWDFPLLTELYTLHVTGQVIQGKANEKYISIITKLNPAQSYLKDDETKTCMKCNTKFTLINRRHHCRFCGKIFCNLCSSKKVKRKEKEEKRSCDDCFNFLSIEFAPLNSTNTSPLISKDKNLLIVDCDQFFEDQVRSVHQQHQQNRFSSEGSSTVKAIQQCLASASPHPHQHCINQQKQADPHHSQQVQQTNHQQGNSSSTSPLKKSKECHGLLPKIGGSSPERKRIKKNDSSDQQLVSTALSKRSHSTSHRFLDVMVTNQPISPNHRRSRSNFNSQRNLNSSLPTPSSSTSRKTTKQVKQRPTLLNTHQVSPTHTSMLEEEDDDCYQLASPRKSKENLIKLLFKETNQDLTVHKELIVNPFQNHPYTDLPEVPRPKYPNLSDKNQSMFTKLLKIQNFISAFEYNYIEQHFFDITRLRPLKSIIQTAKEVVSDCLPIRCVEGTFLSLFCTQDFEDVDRFSVFFQTTMTQRVYRHIVCVVRFKGRFGALGLSRKSDLFYKPLMYFKISEILREYVLSYSKYGHSVQLIYVSLPISHDSSSKDIPVWNFLKLDFEKHEIDTLMDKADKYMGEVTYSNGEKLLERKRRKLKPIPTLSDDEQETDL
ncbi:predicted protein [Naegleria gruberi]|uniref:Predicted protein n=1 Tax=Naegleria gruberi TaxID=5762 RepID=D2VBG6_NAEGR|nr:uncharacterized protein NAEGRDRAFT_48196 [Naegleria gruberi]EFC45905.1 predicted protein [Naegleria gruberi]|eukprot:XP_002678649.1 predicted protein [Naegleria gruberi strain NEG-M]